MHLSLLSLFFLSTVSHYFGTINVVAKPVTHPEQYNKPSAGTPPNFFRASSPVNARVIKSAFDPSSDKSGLGGPGLSKAYEEEYPLKAGKAKYPIYLDYIDCQEVRVSMFGNEMMTLNRE